MSYNAIIQVINPVMWICNFGMEKTLAWTSAFNFGIDTRQDAYKCAANMLCESNGVFLQGFQLTSLMLNMCLCADLILTIQSPFTPASSRAKWYYLVSTVVPIVMVVMIICVDSSYITNGVRDCSTCLDKYQKVSGLSVGQQISGAGNMALAFALSIYIIIAIYSFLFAYRRLERPGVSQEARQMFLKKHLYYVFVFIVIWTI